MQEAEVRVGFPTSVNFYPKARSVVGSVVEGNDRWEIGEWLHGMWRDTEDEGRRTRVFILPTKDIFSEVVFGKQYIGKIVVEDKILLSKDKGKHKNERKGKEGVDSNIKDDKTFCFSKYCLY